MLARLAPPGSRQRTALLWAVVFGALLLYTQLILAGDSGPGRGVPIGILFQGLIVGMLNALSAAGLILIYRTTRIINFAQAVFGLLGAIFVVNMVAYNPGFPFPLTLLLGLALAAGTGALLELVFGRRFAKAPRLVLTVVTIVGGQLLLLLSLDWVIRLPFFPPLDERLPTDFSTERVQSLLPFSGWDGFHIGSLPRAFGFPEILALELVAISFVILAVFLRYTRSGVAVRAAAENAERAALLGIGVGGLGTLVWALAGLLSGMNVTGNMLLGDPVGIGRGTVALLVPLAAAVIARMHSLPVAAAAAVTIGIAAVATEYTYEHSEATVAAAVFVALGASLLVQRRRLFRETAASEEASWHAAEESRPVPRELRGIASVRNTRVALIAVGILAAVLLPFITAVRIQNLLGVIALLTIVGLSIVVLTGWAGQVSLGQFAFVAVGAAVAGWVAADLGWSFWLAVPAGTVATALVAALVGLPALRIRGLYLAVATFAFAVAMHQVLASPRYLRERLPSQVERPTFFFLDFDEERSMYFLCVAALLLCVAVVYNLRRSRFGRLLIAARENEANVQSFGVNLVRVKLLAFVVAGSLAGFAGAIYAFQQRAVNGEAFGVERSFSVFIFTVVGGVSSPAGALLGSAYGSLSEYFLGGNLYWGLFIALIPLVLLYIAPGGLVSILNQLRDSWLRIVAQRRQLVVPSLFADYDPDALARRLVPLGERAPGQGLGALPAAQKYALESGLYGDGDGNGGATDAKGKAIEPRRNREIAAITAASEAGESS